jgi:hypothetical protein
MRLQQNANGVEKNTQRSREVERSSVGFLDVLREVCDIKWGRAVKGDGKRHKKTLHKSLIRLNIPLFTSIKIV